MTTLFDSMTPKRGKTLVFEEKTNFSCLIVCLFVCVFGGGGGRGCLVLARVINFFHAQPI